MQPAPKFLRWTSGVPRLANTAAVLAWNTDKRYLAQLDALGVDVVPETWVHPHDVWHPPELEEGTTRWVIKPAVSLAALDTGRYDLGDPTHRRLAIEHVRRLQRAGRTVMVQPYLKRVNSDGETSLVFLVASSATPCARARCSRDPTMGRSRLASLDEITPAATSVATGTVSFRAKRGIDFRPSGLRSE